MLAGVDNFTTDDDDSIVVVVFVGVGLSGDQFFNFLLKNGVIVVCK